MDLTARILYESPRLRVVYQPAESDLLVFSFNGLNFQGLGRAFFGSSFFAKRGIAAVGIVDNNKTWYPYAEMLSAIEAIQAAIPADAYARRLTYGVSMGGYAALKYSGRLRANAALVFGPQWSIDPELVGRFDSRYAEFFMPGQHTGIKVGSDDLCPRNYVIYDPVIPPDAEHAAILAKSSSVHRVIGSFLGHPGVAYFARSRLLERALRFAAEEDQPDPLAVRRFVRRARAASPDYWLGRATSLHRRKGISDFDRIRACYMEADRLQRESTDRQNNLDALVGLADLMLDARRTNEAAEYMENVWSRADATNYSSEMLHLFLRANAPWRAQKVAQLGLEQQPRNVGLRLDLVKALIAAGETGRANVEIDIARKLAGVRPVVWKRLSWLYGQLGRRRDALAARQEKLDVLASRGEMAMSVSVG